MLSCIADFSEDFKREVKEEVDVYKLNDPYFYKILTEKLLQKHKFTDVTVKVKPTNIRYIIEIECTYPGTDVHFPFSIDVNITEYRKRRENYESTETV